jgi:transcriptional regulator with XRE-family HTH domain
MSKSEIKTFGETLRKLREENSMPLRKLAALLDLDQSTLSKIERNERRANAELINKLSDIFKIDKKSLQISFLSDKVAYELLEEENPRDILEVAEQKISYLKLSKKPSNV